MAYDIPVQIPFRVTSIVEHAASSASSVAQVATKSATSIVSAASSFVETPTAAPTLGALVKKLLLRAAGEEGVAERVGMDQKIRDAMSDPLGVARHELPNVEDKVEKWLETRFETHYRSDWTKVNCIDTSGEAFAIYLNLLYLAPLTFLFARFFVRAYTQRGKRNSFSQAARKASEAAKDASNQTEYEVEKSGMKMEDEVHQRGSEVRDKSAERLEELRKDVKAMKEGTFRDRRVSDRVQSYEEKVKSAAEKAKEYTNGKNGSRKASPSKKSSIENESAIEDEPASTGTNGGADAAKEEEATLDESQATRPGAEEATEESNPPDSDAMGQSGSIIDLSREKAQEASEQAKAESDKPQWKPIGANGT